MEYWVDFLFMLLQGYAEVLFFDAYFQRRYTGWRFWLCAVLCIDGMFLCVNHLRWLFEPFPLEITNSLILFFLINCALYRGKFPARLLVVVMMYALFYCISAACNSIFTVLLEMPKQEYMAVPIWYLVSSAFVNLLFVLVAAWAKQRHRQKRKIETTLAWALLTALFPATTLLVLVCFALTPPAKGQASFMNGLCLAALAIGNLAVLWLLDWLEENAQNQEKVLALGEQIRSQAESIAALSDSYAAQRKITHDFNLHLDTLTTMLARGQEEEARQYLERIKHARTNRILLVNTHHAALDAILNQKAYAAKAQGIDIQFEVNDLSRVQIAPVDCAVVLGNLLQNAIEACAKLEKKQRWIKAQVVLEPAAGSAPEELYIAVRNASPPVHLQRGELVTTKRPAELHGFGIHNIMAILKKYDAGSALWYEDNIFTASIQIKNVAL